MSQSFDPGWSALNPWKRLQGVLEQEACVLVTLNRILGSSPRESGCRMIVTANRQFGSIGGGNLEYRASQEARGLLRESEHPRQVHRPYGLGPALNQCCGGAVTLLYEVLSGECPAWVKALAEAADELSFRLLVLEIDKNDPVRLVIAPGQACPADVPEAVAQVAQDLVQVAADASRGVSDDSGIHEVKTEGGIWWLQRMASLRHPVFLFGAGHVGQCVAHQLEALPFELTWIDSRAGLWPVGLSSQVHTLRCDDPESLVAKAPPGCIFVVMSHRHQLDEDICFRVLERGDFAWLGLIGSHTKRKRFVQRLNRRGVNAETLHRLVCPLGLDGIRGKQPATIALSLAAQLMMEEPWIRANN